MDVVAFCHNSSYMLSSFTATCFGSYIKSHHQADKVPKKSYEQNLNSFRSQRTIPQTKQTEYYDVILRRVRVPIVAVEKQ